MSSSILTVGFPYWLEDVTVEVWRYDGEDIDVFDPISRIEQKVDSL